MCTGGVTADLSLSSPSLSSPLGKDPHRKYACPAALPRNGPILRGTDLDVTRVARPIRQGTVGDRCACNVSQLVEMAFVDAAGGKGKAQT